MQIVSTRELEWQFQTKYSIRQNTLEDKKKLLEKKRDIY